MTPFVIPSIFTAVDKLTAPMRKMAGSLNSFIGISDSGIARQERMFRRLTPVLSEASKQFLSYASTAAMAGAIVGGVVFSAKSVMDYEKAVASFRTIVSDLDDEAFKPFQDKINQVAKETKKSSIETAQAFEKIASLNAKFAETADSIGQVSQAAIILSKASGDELGSSAESLVGIMNQFSLKADQANRTINVLAAGAGVGAASIVQTSEAFVNFGSVAAGANISLEQSVGLIQTMGKYSVFGAEAGTKLRGSILRLQKAGMGYASGQFQINDALEEARKKVDKLKTSKQKDAELNKIFGAENIATGRILLNNIQTYQEFTKGVTDTNEAQKQAEIRSQTLSNKLEELKAAWINMLTGSDQATEGLNIAKKAIGFVTKNLGTIVTWGVRVIGFFIAWKALLIASKAILIVYNVALGIHSALTGASSLAMKGNVVALAAQKVAMGASTAAQWALNAAMAANPVALVVLAIMALVGALAYLIANYKTVQQLHEEGKEKNRVQAMSQEAQQVQLLADKYKKLGYSAADANKRALEVSRTTLQADLADVKSQYINAKTDSQRRIAEKRFASLEGRAKGISSFEQGIIPSEEKAPISNKVNTQQALEAIMNTKTEANFTINAPEGTTITSNGNNENVSANIIPKTTSTGNW